MADKSFVIKNSLTVNTNLIFASAGQVGINNSSPDANLTLTGSSNLNGNVAISGVLSTININSSYVNVAGAILTNSTALSLGSNVSLNMAGLSVGTAVLQSTFLNIGNSTVNSVVNSTAMLTGVSVQNNAGFFVAGTTQLTSASLSLGNSSTNSVINSTAISLSGQKIVSSPAFVSLNPNVNINWDMSQGFNATFQINTAAIFHAPTNYILGASYALLITQANGGSHALTFSAANVVFDFGQVGTPLLSTSNGAGDFIFMIPYQANSTVVTIRAIFNKSSLV